MNTRMQCHQSVHCIPLFDVLEIPVKIREFSQKALPGQLGTQALNPGRIEEPPRQRSDYNSTNTTYFSPLRLSVNVCFSTAAVNHTVRIPPLCVEIYGGKMKNPSLVMQRSELSFQYWSIFCQLLQFKKALR